MEEDKIKKLRQYYHSLIGFQKVFEAEKAYKQYVIEQAPVNLLQGEYNRIQADFPNLIPPFNPSEFLRDTGWYQLNGLLAHLGMAIGRLRIEIDQNEGTPVIELRKFPFVNDSEIRKILERDDPEIQRAFIANCWKSVIILSGGAIEAILLDVLLKNKTLAESAKKTPKGKDLARWDLSELIDVCVELKLVTPGVEKLSHSIREYRNLVHPGNEIRSKLTFGPEEARIALEVLNMVYRDLSK